jgi:hypothetical protein
MIALYALLMVTLARQAADSRSTASRTFSPRRCVVLNDHERKTLRDIQQQLSVDDPDFERSFQAFETPAPQMYRRLIYAAGIVIAALLAVVGLLAGSAGGALLFAVIAGLVWLTQRLHDGTSTTGR